MEIGILLVKECDDSAIFKIGEKNPILDAAVLIIISLYTSPYFIVNVEVES